MELTEQDVDGLTPWKMAKVEGAELVNDSDLVSDREDEDGDDIPWSEDLGDRVIDLLESADVFPEDVADMDDAALLDVPGIGPEFLKQIRDAYPVEG